MDESQKKDRDVLLPGAIVVAALLIAGALVYNTGSRAVVPPANEPSFKGSLASADDVILGNPDAPVLIVEFGDYQCPFCGKFFTEVETQIRDQYIKTGKAKMVFRDFPFLGPESELAAQAAECAAEQDKFWAYHDELYRVEIVDGREHNGNLNIPLFKSLASKLGLNVAQFDSCLVSNKYQASVQKDYDDGVAANVSGTPTTFINEKAIVGAVPYSQFKAAIDAALAGKK